MSSKKSMIWWMNILYDEKRIEELRGYLTGLKNANGINNDEYIEYTDKFNIDIKSL